MNCTNPWAYIVKTRNNKDQDNSTFHEAIHGAYVAEYQRDMFTEAKEMDIKDVKDRLID